MNQIICLSTILVFLRPINAEINAEENFNPQFMTRIYKGEPAPFGEYRHHVYLTARVGSQRYHSGGSVANRRYILTAAHSFDEVEDARLIKAYVGSLYRLGRDRTVYSIDRRIPHENYVPGSIANDIALLHTAQDIEFNYAVQPVRLVSETYVIRDGQRATIAGFGKVQGGGFADRLQHITLTLRDFETCKQLVPNMVETQVCAILQGGRGPCSGDSGGALMNEAGFQIGIDSLTHRRPSACCGLIKAKWTGPVVFTKISSFRVWIDQKISTGA